MTFNIGQRVRILRNCIVTGEYLTQGMTGTVVAVSEYQQPPVIMVKFAQWPLPIPMWESEISEVAPDGTA